MGAEIITVEVAVLPAPMVTVDGLILMTRFPVTRVVFRLTVPAKLLRLVTLTVEGPEAPWVIVIAFGVTVITKSGVVLVENVMVCATSGTGFGVPFATSTQMVVPETLLKEQPVWNPSEVPEVAPVTL